MLILPVENLVSRLILNHSSLNEEITNSATLDVFFIFIFIFFWGGVKDTADLFQISLRKKPSSL